MLKLTFREIRTSFGRFLSIFAIIALGAGFFCGLKLTKTCMIYTLNEYVQDRNMYDYELISSLGFIDDDVDEIAKNIVVSEAEGSKQGDIIFDLADGSDVFHTVSLPNKINIIEATSGRLPENPKECALDSWYYTEDMIGETITISEDNSQDDIDNYKYKEYKVVGLVQSPLYINYERGGSSVGDGSVAGYVYLMEDSYDTDYFTHIFLTLSHSVGEVFSDEYDDTVDAYEDEITNLCEKRADIRYDKLTSDAKRELADARKELDDATAKLNDAKDEYDKYKLFMSADDKEEAEKEISDAEQELADAEIEYNDGVDKLNDIKYPDCYILNRSSNVGYVCFESDAEIVNAVAKVFPLFFFAVAALVCITTMTRMVDEQRTQLGVLKAIGYSNVSIMSKFLIYSSIASVLGCAFGIAVGSYTLPKIIWQAYNIMYGFTDILFAFDWELAIISSASYLLCSIFATWFSCRNELKSTAADLIRPRPPKSGKRILLERIGFIWNHISFLKKVSIRNIFRYKQRMLIMILGIGGCTALLLTGYGIRDSIQGVVGYQFTDISHYDCSLNFVDPLSEDDMEEFQLDYSGDVSDILFIRDSIMDCSYNSTTKTAHVVVAENNTIDDFIDMKNGDDSVSYPKKDECVISIGLSEALGIYEGDQLKILDDSLGELNLKVVGIYNNYVYNYVFLTNDTYIQQTGEQPEYKSGWVKIKESSDFQSVNTKFSGDDRVARSELVEDLRVRMENMMAAMNYIVLVVVICAGALAFIVLYNLTNISITERLREIATVKVLGFHDIETALYVFRENIALTIVGAIVGIPLGFALHSFVMNQIKIDMIHFDTRILTTSIAISIGLTFFFGLVVNLALNKKLKAIDMAQALKSIE